MRASSGVSVSWKKSQDQQQQQRREWEPECEQEREWECEPEWERECEPEWESDQERDRDSVRNDKDLLNVRGGERRKRGRKGGRKRGREGKMLLIQPVALFFSCFCSFFLFFFKLKPQSLDSNKLNPTV